MLWTTRDNVASSKGTKENRPTLVADFRQKLIQRVRSHVDLKSWWNVSELNRGRIEYTVKLSFQRHGLNQETNEDSLVIIECGQLLHEILVRYGIKHIFVCWKKQIEGLCDPIQTTRQFQTIVSQDSQEAGSIASGYAKSSDRPGVIILSEDKPLTFLRDAFYNKLGIVIINFQASEKEINSEYPPFVKTYLVVRNLKDFSKFIEEAFHICMEGQPGPVLVLISSDIYQIPTIPNSQRHFKPPRKTKSFKELRQHYHIINTINLTAKKINKSKRPLIYAGRGIMASPGGPELLKKLAQMADIPVTTTVHALGIFDEEDSRSLKMVGRYGSVEANLAMQHADLIIALGVGFDIHVTGDPSRFAPSARLAEQQGKGGIIQFERDNANINRNIPITIAVQGDVGHNLGYLLPLIQPHSHFDWFQQIDTWRNHFPILRGPSLGKKGLLRPQHILKELDDLTADMKDDIIFTTGAGLLQMWSSQHLTWRRPNMITSSYQSSQGFAIPAAIGAQLLHPNKTIIAIENDSSLLATFPQIITAIQHKINIKILIIHHESQSYINPTNDLFYDRSSPNHPLSQSDLIELAQSYDCHAIRCCYPDTLNRTLQSFLNYPKPVVLEVMADRYEKVLPMIPPGAALHEMTLSNGQRLHISDLKN